MSNTHLIMPGTRKTICGQWLRWSAVSTSVDQTSCPNCKRGFTSKIIESHKKSELKNWDFRRKN